MNSCHACGGEIRLQAFAQLVTAYAEPHRHYHNLEHILCMMDQVLIFLLARKDPELERVELAIWYHDVVYNPKSSENETRSADVARNSLGELGLSEDCVSRVCELILMTNDHQAPLEDKNAQLFLDGDLGILGTMPEFYLEYSNAIRKEYAWVADREYYQARRKVLLGFLERPTIYHSPGFRDFEAPARANLAAEIAQIDEILRTLPS